MKNHQFVNDTAILFEGFYESNLFNSDTEFYLNEILQDSEHPETYEITGQNYKDYEKSVCELHVDSLNEVLNDFEYYTKNRIVKKIKFEKMTSPKYYNFESELLYVLVDFNLNDLKKYGFDTEKNDFEFYLQKKYTSYSGYISFIENNLYGFKKQYSYIEYKNRCINVMLEYYFIRAIFDNKTAEKIYNEGLSHVDTDYKQRIYEKLSELEIEYATVIEDIKQAV